MTVTTEASNSVYELSDDDFLNTPLDELKPEDEPTATDEYSEEVDEQEEATDDEGGEDAADEPEDTGDVSDVESETVEAEKGIQAETEVEDDTTEVSDKDSETERDYKAEIEELFKPFKANGREVQVNNVQEAVQLMQMGANYAKKMSALKPNLKLVKMLDNNGLLDEAKLNHLIDISKKDKGAIQKLLSESGIDPLDLDSDGDKSYTPNNHRVSDAEMEVDNVLADIKDTPTYQNTISTITQWDETSRQELVKHPEVIKFINEHMSNGIYDKITTEIDRRKMLGQVPNGTPALHLYKQVGDELFANANTNGSNTPEQSKEIIKPSNVAKPSVVSSKKKLAATPNKGKVKKTADSSMNPLLMSDEEYEKTFSMQHLF